jgi:precorrin-4 methylase
MRRLFTLVLALLLAVPSLAWGGRDLSVPRLASSSGAVGAVGSDAGTLGGQGPAKGRFFVIGTGPAGPPLCTLQALERMAALDAVVAPQELVDLFAEYIGGKPVLFDPLPGLWDYKGTWWEELAPGQMAAFEAERERIITERVAEIHALLEAGQDVGMVDLGNPSLYGPAHFYLERMAEDEVVIIPGMGSDAAAMAVLGKSALPAFDSRFLIQSAPFSLFTGEDEADRQVLEHMAQYPSTMILYMALKDPEALFETLGAALPADLPVAVVFWAGHPDKERVMRGTVGDMGPRLAADPEHLMGLLFLGRFLEGKPYAAGVEQATEPRR